MKVNTLTTRWRYRLGGTAPAPSTDQSERRYADFLIDETPLRNMFGSGLIGALGWGVPEYEVQLVNQLLLRADPPRSRQMLLVCPECGDLGCGAITADVSLSAGLFVWSQFGFENDYDPNMSEFDSYRSVGPFAFEAGPYEAVLRGALVRGDV
ncbi:MAG TPA: hypothetical protein VGS03_04540 [Candidatus Polarisedimenticolia bacterium]|jgi:hypothetical protein|nr:hypothetical protein [Candidatus Polarisedimenticolia bacterium]